LIAWASFAISILCAWVWASYLAPAIIRGFGVPVASGWRLVRRNQYLSRLHYVWGCGVAAVGSGLFLFISLRQCMCCFLIAHKFPRVSGPYLGLRLIICLGAGWLFGVFTAPQYETLEFPPS
jgi:hypothetical protein